MRKCLFCGGRENLTQEHIIARWLQRELDISQETVHILGGSENRLRVERELVFNKFTDGRICRTCNSNWMSKLEDENKQHILKLMRMEDIEDELAYLSEGGNDSLAKWAFKTALLLGNTAKDVLEIPPSHFEALYHRRIPDGVIIEVAFSEKAEAAGWKAGDATWNEPEMNDAPYMVMLQLEHLLIRVTYNMKESQMNIDNDTFEIYPECGLKGEFRIYQDMDAMLMHCDNPWNINPLGW